MYILMLLKLELQWLFHYSSDRRTWEPTSLLGECEERFREFWQIYGYLLHNEQIVEENTNQQIRLADERRDRNDPDYIPHQPGTVYMKLQYVPCTPTFPVYPNLSGVSQCVPCIPMCPLYSNVSRISQCAPCNPMYPNVSYVSQCVPWTYLDTWDTLGCMGYLGIYETNWATLGCIGHTW